MASDSNSENQDAVSSSLNSSLAEDSLNISFEDITYTVRDGFRGRKTVLDRLNGTFSAGELTVIMGLSGAGKSSLMDILAGYTQPTSGNVYINGRLRNPNSFLRRSCYILQDVRVQDFLTTQESLAIAAELKLGNHVSKQQKVKRIEEVILSLGLNQVRNTRAMYLSGGQKKRLAIGLELVTDPPVLFLDEPTSGLDSSISKSTLYLLHLLARQGRTVVATMHQPSAALLDMVDRLYTIVSGRCAYMGSVSMLLPFLKQIDLICPEYHNPVDFLIEVSADRASDLVIHSQNGKDPRWIVNIQNETDIKIERNKSYLCCNTIEEVFLTTLPSPKEDPTNKILLKLKSTYSTSFWKQFTTLTKRSLLSTCRDRQLTLMSIGIHIMMALFISVLFYNIGEDAKYGRDNYSCLFYNLMFLMFTAFSSVTVTFPQQIPVIRREHFNRWYMAEAYYCSTLVSSLPTQTICTLTYAVITYWLTGQPQEWIRFIIYCTTMVLVTYVAQCMGLLNGSLFNIKLGVVFGPLFIMPFVIFSGFFLVYKDAPYIFRWIFQISFLKHGLVALTIAIYGMDRPKLPCSALFCFYTYPKQFFIERDMVYEELWVAILVLVCLSVALQMVTYLILKLRLKSKW